MADKEIFAVETEPSFTPFWRRMPRFFVYPMQLGPMLRMGLGALFCTFSPYLLGILGVFIAGFIFLAFLKYSFVVLERTANGRFDEPNNLNGEEGGEMGQVFRMFGLFIILSIVAGLLTEFLGTVGEGISWVLFNITLPASIMIIATSHSLFRALNPGQVFFHMRTIGSPYLAMCFLLLSLMGSGAWLIEFLAEHVQSWVVVPLVIFVMFYFTLIMYHMMGYVIYQYHDKLGLHAAVSFEKAEAQLSPNKPAADPIMARLAALMAEGKEQEAASMLREELRTQWERNDLHERYQKLLVALGKTDVALSHGRDFIGKLVMEKKMFQALDLCEWGLKTDPSFQPGNPDHVHELAAAASVANRHKLALDLMRGFDKRYPGHKHTAPVYLLSAKILAEKYHKYVEAGKILRALQAKFPEHALASEAKKYQEALTKLEAIG